MHDRGENGPARATTWWRRTRGQRRRIQRRFVDGVVQGIGILLVRLLGHLLP